MVKEEREARLRQTDDWGTGGIPERERGCLGEGLEGLNRVCALSPPKKCHGANWARSGTTLAALARGESPLAWARSRRAVRLASSPGVCLIAPRANRFPLSNGSLESVMIPADFKLSLNRPLLPIGPNNLAGSLP
ncbi:hypothetical protein OOK60_13240 [Trichothermofontia sichuanensis B231]|uniref:hypothetical protein n=1 Tax=Trichothermofontia sichuanensis TaxID=3045816 RepID=UPI00224750C1|nr:hypothetical protein [Trichothermofontia sichuanensis]UZQ53461.1 hypothetical protein OOK60_13240 [Trichothermofontia sichuanensis B231]